MFYKKSTLKNFTKFTGKHLCQSIFFNKVAGLKPATLLKKRLWHRCFPVNFVKFLRTPFLTEHLRWMLLKQVYFCTLLAHKDRGYINFSSFRQGVKTGKKNHQLTFFFAFIFFILDSARYFRQ